MDGTEHSGTGKRSHSFNKKVFSVFSVQFGSELLQATVYIHEVNLFAGIKPCFLKVILIAGSGVSGHGRYSQLVITSELFIQVLVTISDSIVMKVFLPLSIITGRLHDTVHEIDI